MQMSVISSRSLALGSRSSALVIGVFLHVLLILVTQADTSRSGSALFTSNVPIILASITNNDLTTKLPTHESTEQISLTHIITNATSSDTTFSSSVVKTYKISSTKTTTTTTKKPPAATTKTTTKKPPSATTKTTTKKPTTTTKTTTKKPPPTTITETTTKTPPSTTTTKTTTTKPTTTTTTQTTITKPPTTTATKTTTTKPPPTTTQTTTTKPPPTITTQTTTKKPSSAITTKTTTKKPSSAITTKTTNKNAPSTTTPASSFTRNKTTTVNIIITNLITQSYNTSKATVLHLNTTVETETTTPVNIPTTHTTNTDTETHTSSQLSTQLSTTSTWVSPSSLKPNISTRKSTTSQPTQPPPSTNTKYCKVNEIFLSGNPTKQYIEIKKSETSTEVVYTIVFFSNVGKGTVCDRINGTSPYFISKCSSVNLYEKLGKTGSVAIAVYRTNGEISIQSKGLQDAVVLVFPGKSVSSTLRKLKQNNSYVEYDLKEKGDSSVSRCGDKFVQLQTSQASKGEKNSKCPQHGVHPIRNEPEKDNVKVTVAVVFSCLAVFLAIIVFSVIWMRRRNPGIRHLRLSSIGKDDDDDLILNMETVDEFEGENDDPTFKNSTYNCLKLK